MVKRILLREEYFGGLLYDRVEEKQEILNRWQTKALQLVTRVPNNELLKILQTRSLVAENYDSTMDDKSVRGMNKKRPTLDELIDFLETKKDVLVNGKLQAHTTKIKRKLEYPMLSAPLGIFHIGLTSLCNMACVHCYNSDAREKIEKGEGLLTTEQILKFFNQSKDMGIFFMKLQGGEPVLYQDWKKIAQESIDHGFATTLYTGGYFKGRDHVLDEIAAMDFSEIRITFAGLEELHNKLRPAKPVINGKGTPSYHEINRTLDYLLKKGVHVKLNFVLGRNNMHQVEKFARTMAAKARHYNNMFDINFGPQRPFGEGFSCPGDPNGKNMMRAEDFYKVNQLIEKLRYSAEIQDAGMNLIIVFDMLSDKKDYKLIPRDLQKNGCGLGKRGMSVNYEGEIGICSFMTACGILPSGGNIKQQTLEELWYNSELLKQGRLYEKKQCIDCEYYTNPCQGICPAMCVYEQYKQTGEYNLEGGKDPGCFKHLINKEERKPIQEIKLE